ncbi:hypothetical protein K458DRAFT_465383 [Lentithecium fluviatile CBS 122367]|uniref:Uncharacterized protein n=1 Tax=Lentithecium fluviatile CBS 122367 TaxID=1168545 RepID=A0A6G1JE04_9PLEO|nr:hypothetical protein K458DRAFT_465383 [Lentithecium fluviatile CBS 122367]
MLQPIPHPPQHTLSSTMSSLISTTINYIAIYILAFTFLLGILFVCYNILSIFWARPLVLGYLAYPFFICLFYEEMDGADETQTFEIGGAQLELVLERGRKRNERMGMTDGLREGLDGIACVLFWVLGVMFALKSSGEDGAWTGLS